MTNPPNIFDAALRRALSGLGVAIDDEQVARLRAHFDAMVETNRTMNLTRITDPAEAAVRHYADSLALLAWARDRGVTVGFVLDVGTGAGFPAIPLAVMRPGWSVTAIDGSGKKIEFVERVGKTIGLTNLHAVHEHSSQWRTSERFDVVLFRALAAFPKAIDRTASFVAPDGRLVAYRTDRDDPASFQAAVEAAARAQLTLDEPYAYELPADEGDTSGDGDAASGERESGSEGTKIAALGASVTLSRRLVIFRRSG